MKSPQLPLFCILLLLFFLLSLSSSGSADTAARGSPAAVSGVPPAATTPSPCGNPGRCREIDVVWGRIQGPLQLSGEAATKIWDNGKWESFDSVYPPVSAAGIPPRSGPNAYDDIITKAAAEFGVDAALIKAIIRHESNFDPLKISPTGCVGLMQICTTSAQPDFITKMTGQEVTPINLDEIKSCCEKADCSSNRQKCGGTDVWCEEGEYRCNRDNDDRFDPDKNIMSGTKTLKGMIMKITAITTTTTTTCGTACQIAAYNAGQCVVIKASEQLSSTEPRTWDNIYSKITPDLLKDKCGYTDDKGWTDDEREQKVKRLKSYVNNVLQTYNGYNLPPS